MTKAKKILSQQGINQMDLIYSWKRKVVAMLRNLLPEKVTFVLK